VGSRARRPHHRLQATHSHQVVGSSRLHGRVAGEPATYSNRATRALDDVLRRLTQPRGRRCSGTPDLSNGLTTQVHPADLLEGLKQRSRVRSSPTRAPPRGFTGKLGSTRAQVPAGIFVHELHAPSIPEQAPPTTVPVHPPVGQEVMMIAD
jgi:hypothetical protein